MHLDEDILAMVALGDHELDEGERAHVAQCKYCATELDAISHLLTRGRDAAEIELVAPASDVWQAIHAELALTDAVAADPLSRSGAAGGVVEMTSAVSERGAETANEPSATVTPIDSAHRSSGFGRWWPVAVAALFVGVVLGIAGAQLWSPTATQVVAKATLDPFPNWQAAGSAQLEDSNGSRELVVELDAPSGGFREVWLINPETSGLLSLGFLDGTSGHFTVPADVDLSAYSLVDISEEPGDGNPGHSGDSIVRGELRLI